MSPDRRGEIGRRLIRTAATAATVISLFSLPSNMLAASESETGDPSTRIVNRYRLTTLAANSWDPFYDMRDNLPKPGDRAAAVRIRGHFSGGYIEASGGIMVDERGYFLITAGHVVDDLRNKKIDRANYYIAGLGEGLFITDLFEKLPKMGSEDDQLAKYYFGEENSRIIQSAVDAGDLKSLSFSTTTLESGNNVRVQDHVHDTIAQYRVAGWLDDQYAFDLTALNQGTFNCGGTSGSPVRNIEEEVVGIITGGENSSAFNNADLFNVPCYSSLVMRAVVASRCAGRGVVSYCIPVFKVDLPSK